VAPACRLAGSERGPVGRVGDWTGDRIVLCTDGMQDAPARRGAPVAPLRAVPVKASGPHPISIPSRTVRCQGWQVDRLRFVFLHAVRAEHDPVSRSQIQVLDPVSALPGHAEGQVHLQAQFLDLAVAHPQGPGVAGVDELRAAAVQGDAHQLPGGEGAPAVLDEGLGLAGLLGEVHPGGGRRGRRDQEA
jgi:hypothetical protein